LLAIPAKSIAIAVAIVGGKSIAVLIAILLSKSLLQYYCNTFCNTPLSASLNKFRFLLLDITF